jgi:hypothetical protein
MAAPTVEPLKPVAGPPLSDLAASIKSEHAQLMENARNIVGRAIRIGEDLLKAKAQVGHGNFLKWVKDNCGLSDKTAERYMKFAENKDKLNVVKKDKFETILNLTLNAAERLIDGKDEKKTKTPLDRIENAWDKLDLPTQEAFVEAKYSDLAKLMKEIDRKAKAA